MRHETIHKPEILILYMEPKKFQVPGYDLTLRFFNFLQLQEVIVKGNLQFVQKMKLWGLEKLQKLLLLKFCSPTLQKHTIKFFFVTVLFNYFYETILPDDFWGIHKNKNCTFPFLLYQGFWISYKASCVR